MKNKILIVDDSELNREFLSDILEDEYELILAENGFQALMHMKNNINDIALVLLDLVMPEMDGFKVLSYMDKYNWMQDIPVIIISSDMSSDNVERAYELGAEDFINRPFNIRIVKKRVSNLISLYSKQKKLKSIVAQQIYEKEKRSSLMISILSHIVEFRNGESGMHILNINNITEKLLYSLMRNHEDINLTVNDISLIKMASSLHDIGKISIPDDILNKPGRLTDEEFAVMKTHSEIGANIIKDLKWDQKDPLIKTAYEICRWHHERWDGRGYPDGLRKDEIPLSAQVVAMADVYDALTSERCYKKAIPHEEAIEMIIQGKCGEFNPLIKEALLDIEKELKTMNKRNIEEKRSSRDIGKLALEINKYDELNLTRQMMEQLEIERKKINFFTEKLSNISFVYNCSLDMLFLSKKDALRLDTSEVLLNPLSENSTLSLTSKETLAKMIECARQTTFKNPDFEFECTLLIDGEEKLCHFICRTMWMYEKDYEFIEIVGIIDQEISKEDKHNPEVFSIHSVKEKQQVQVNKMQASQMMDSYKKVFDVVRLVDVERSKVVEIDDHGEFIEMPYACYSTWNRCEKCSNCISSKAKTTRRNMTKFEFVNNEFYYVIAEYIEIDGQDYVLELVSKIKDNIEIATRGKSTISKSLVELQKKLYTDELTGVYNRRYLEDRIYEEKTICAVAMVDLDYFKHTNDEYGHFVGDLVLCETAKVMVENVRSNDSVIRYGGDEFIIMFNEVPKHIVEKRLNQICTQIEKTLLKNTNIRQTCSIGCAFGSYNVNQLLYKADDMLYKAKEKRNCVVVEYVKEENNDDTGVL